MKKPFRYFRGELNGYFLQRLCAVPNYAVDDVIDEIIYHSTMQWKLESEVSGNESAIRADDIYGIGKTAGLFKPVFIFDSNVGSVRFTESKIASGKERSERGLFNMASEAFEFVRTAQDDYDTDIAVEASENKRMSLVPSEQAVVGYVRYDTPLYDENGNVIQSSILPNAPTDGTPYSEYYGEKFLTLEHTKRTTYEITVDIFKSLFEAMQKIRFNTPNLSSLFEITALICEGVVKDMVLSHDEGGRFDYIYYTFDGESAVLQKDTKLAVWQKIMKQKYKNIEFLQV